ncbi:MAG: DNA repair protein RecO [Clostridia bacterium]|nr:DNA repair protein RecO [Clostridia bacterium]
MADLTLRGMVIRTVDYRDNDRILTLFTAEQGRVDAKARNCRKATSPLLACTQPFTYGEYQLFCHKNKYIVDQGEVLESFYPLREDVERFAAAALCTGLCLEGVQAEESSADVFSLLYHTLSFLTYGDNDPGDLAACFLIRFLSLVGFRPAITHCAVCGRDLREDPILRFLPDKGGAVCAACAPVGRRIGKTALEAMRRMLLLDDDQIGRVKLKTPLRDEILSQLLPYATWYLPGIEKAAALFTSLHMPPRAAEQE